MQKTDKIWFNGKIVDWDDAKVHVLAHSLHYGSGVFEGIRFYETTRGPAVFRLTEHVDRLFYSATQCRMQPEFTKEEIATAIINLIATNKLTQGYVRPLAYFDYGKLGLDPRGCVTKIAIATYPWGAYLGDKPARCKISSYIRIHPQSTCASAKICGHYVNSIMARLELDARHDEAILLDHEGYLAEGSGENIFLVKDGVLLTPALGNILPGITRATTLAIAQNLGIPTVERKILPEELFAADEAFLTGTAAEITPIGTVDERPIGNGNMGPITQKLKEIFHEATTGKLADYLSWLTFVE